MKCKCFVAVIAVVLCATECAIAQTMPPGGGPTPRDLALQAQAAADAQLTLTNVQRNRARTAFAALPDIEPVAAALLLDPTLTEMQKMEVNGVLKHARDALAGATQNIIGGNTLYNTAAVHYTSAITAFLSGQYDMARQLWYQSMQENLFAATLYYNAYVFCGSYLSDYNYLLAY